LRCQLQQSVEHFPSQFHRDVHRTPLLFNKAFISVAECYRSGMTDSSKRKEKAERINLPDYVRRGVGVFLP
jgi:hypothetical protein